MDSQAAKVLSILSESDYRWVERGARSPLVEVAGKRVRRVLSTPSIAIPLAILMVIIIGCFLGPIIFNLPNPDTSILKTGSVLAPIGTQGHLLGTDQLGRDNLSRILYGGQVSIVVGLGASAFGLGIGTLLGMVAGFFGGPIGGVIMRGLDALLAFPGLILALAIAEFLGPSEFHTILAICAFSISTFGRLARSRTISIRDRDYVIAARLNGINSGKIIRTHILPNVLPPIMAYATITVGVAMLLEAGLSFLGLGIKPPQPSWGNLIASGEASLLSAPQIVIEPALVLFLTVLALNILGDSLRRNQEWPS